MNTYIYKIYHSLYHGLMNERLNRLVVQQWVWQDLLRKLQKLNARIPESPRCSYYASIPAHVFKSHGCRVVTTSVVDCSPVLLLQEQPFHSQILKTSMARKSENLHGCLISPHTSEQREANWHRKQCVPSNWGLISNSVCLIAINK